MNHHIHLLLFALLTFGLGSCALDDPGNDDDSNSDDDDSNSDDDDSNSDDDDSTPPEPPEIVIPKGSVPCADPMDDYTFDWTLRWGGDEYPSDNRLYEGWVENGGSFIASFSGLVDTWGDDPEGGGGRYFEILEFPPGNAPPPPDPDRLRVHYTLPDGLELPLTLGQPVQAELNISRDGMIVRTGVALWTAMPQARELIVLFEGSPGGVALPGGDGHLFSDISFGETECPETTLLNCTGAHPAPVYLTPNKGVQLFPDDPNSWEVWPGTTLVFADQIGEYTLGVAWSWKYLNDTCPNAQFGTDIGLFVVNHTYQFQ